MFYGSIGVEGENRGKFMVHCLSELSLWAEEEKKNFRARRKSRTHNPSYWVKALRGQKQILLMFEQIIAFTLHLSILVGVVAKIVVEEGG